MNILYDGRIFQMQKAGGINRYFAEIIGGLPEEWCPIVTGVEDFGKNAPRHARLCTENPLDFRPRRFRPRYLEDWWKPRLARRIDLLHPTYYDLTCDFKWSDFKCPLVVTVYDMIYALFPDQIDGAETIIRAQREAVLRADKIICISRATERDLTELIPEAKGKTEVIYLGSSFSAPERFSDQTDSETPQFLFVGGRGGYKNFLFLLRAFAQAASTVKNIRLHVAGAPLTTEERWQIHFLGINEKVSCTVYPDEPTLQNLYLSSIALLYPSRYEGFGIPPLEAMACGTIAVTSNTTSLPEVVGDAGIMLDATQEEQWSDCIVKLAQPFPEYAALRERGRVRANQFTWSRCVSRHLQIYKEMGAAA